MCNKHTNISKRIETRNLFVECSAVLPETRTVSSKLEHSIVCADAKNATYLYIYWPDFGDLCAVFFAVCGCVYMSMPSAACRVIEWPLHHSAAQISADTTGMHAVHHTLPFDRVHNIASKSIRLDCLTLAQSLAKMALACACVCDFGESRTAC